MGLSFEERFGNVAADQTRSLGPSAAHDEPLRSNVDRLVERAEREDSAIEKRVFLKANLPRHTETDL